MIYDLHSLGSVSHSLLLDQTFPLSHCLTDMETLGVITLPLGPTVHPNFPKFGNSL